MKESFDSTLDRTTWGAGEWDHEPDKIEWIYKKHPCCIWRRQLGSWCGYAAVDKTHPFYKVDYDDEHLSPDRILSVHGELTFSGKLRDCPEKVWWFGFDCAHVGDLILIGGSPHHKGMVYRNKEYVIAEVTKLVDQLIEIKKRNKK